VGLNVHLLLLLLLLWHPLGVEGCLEHARVRSLGQLWALNHLCSLHSCAGGA
jgi:hypothetical protein